jgi:hypothetical protein
VGGEGRATFGSRVRGLLCRPPSMIPRTGASAPKKPARLLNQWRTRHPSRSCLGLPTITTRWRSGPKSGRSGRHIQTDPLPKINPAGDRERCYVVFCLSPERGAPTRRCKRRAGTCHQHQGEVKVPITAPAIARIRTALALVCPSHTRRKPCLCSIVVML